MDEKRDNTATYTGITVDGLLGVAFVVLKLTHVIDWKWVWVLAPLWIPYAVVLIVIAVIITVTAVKR